MNPNENLNLIELVERYNLNKLTPTELLKLKKAGELVLRTDEHIYNKLREYESQEKFNIVVKHVLDVYYSPLLGPEIKGDDQLLVYILLFIIVLSSTDPSILPFPIYSEIGKTVNFIINNGVTSSIIATYIIDIYNRLSETKFR